LAANHLRFPRAEEKGSSIANPIFSEVQETAAIRSAMMGICTLIYERLNMEQAG
jgi:hypothetical protein